MLSTLLALARLARPLFLIGGMLGYALGVSIARYQGHALTWEAYLAGQVFALGMQVMAHWLGAYWDWAQPVRDKSQPLPAALAPAPSRESLFAATMLALTLGSAAGVWWLFQAPAGAWAAALALMLLIFLGAYFYTSPPLTLIATGYGELIYSIIAAGLIPALGHYLQAHSPSLLVLLSTAPLVVFHTAMLLADEFPTFLVDEAAGKKTLLVRLGRRLGITVHTALLLIALALAVAASFLGLPARAALSIVIVAPLILLQVMFFR
jgi:1,4-dihydroxy-2-naphthoate octaprenyltransferase